MKSAGFYAAPEVEKLKREIGTKTVPFHEQKVVEKYRGFELVRFAYRYYGIPETIGEIDLLKASNYTHPEILVAPTEKNIKALIDGNMAQPFMTARESIHAGAVPPEKFSARLRFARRVARNLPPSIKTKLKTVVEARFPWLLK